ncbi:hypothetical protein SLS60_004480 [Paraconiothyrium brasiliense]|uniref:Uncharacterized protein n=1 Tax=Paraconiothyrium brasiliense TaxID=300254 RepID=A0ABR3RKG6_9PLEO
MAQPSDSSGPGPSISALNALMQRSYIAACTEMEEELQELYYREDMLKQSFWALNGRYGQLGVDTTKEILALRRQLAEAGNGQNTATNATAAEDQEVHKEYKKALLHLKDQELRRLMENHQSGSQGSGEEHQREAGLLYEQWADKLDQEVTRLLNEHAIAIRSKVQSARARERRICENEHDVMIDQLKEMLITEGEKREQATMETEREIGEKKRDAMIAQLKKEHATEIDEREQSARAHEKKACEEVQRATIDRLRKTHTTEIEAREQSARAIQKEIYEKERDATIRQLKEKHEAEILACHNDYIAKISHNDKAYEAKLLELKTERANSLRDRNEKNRINQHHQEEKKLWQNNVDKLEQEHHQELCGLREEYEHKLADLEAEKQQLDKQHGDRVQKILSQVEEHKAKATAVQKSYDKALEDLQSAKAEIERQVGLTRDSEMKIKAPEQHQSQILSQLGLSRDSETKNKTLEQHHSQILSQLGAKHTAETLRLREEADALRSELRNLRLKLAYNAQIIEDLKTNEGVLWEKLALQTAENLSLKVQSDELEKELAGKDAVNTQLRSAAIATLSSQHEVETICSQQEVSSQQQTEKEEHAKISAEEVVAQEKTGDGPKEVLLLNPNVKLGVAKQAESLDEAQSQIRELLSRLSDSQKKINTLQEQQDALVQHNLCNWIAETTMAQARPSSPVPSCEGAILVSLPLDTEEANRQEQVLQQIIKEYMTLEEECQREEAALGTSKAKLRTLNAKLKALEKEHADEFTWKAARRR